MDDQSPDLSNLNIRAKLVSRKTGQVYILTKECITIGRNEEMDIVINSQSVSAEHARILFEEEKAFIEDLDSLNGVFLNNSHFRKSSYELTSGDNIRFGLSKITFSFHKGDEDIDLGEHDMDRIITSEEDLKINKEFEYEENERPKRNDSISYPTSEGHALVPLKDHDINKEIERNEKTGSFEEDEKEFIKSYVKGDTNEIRKDINMKKKKKREKRKSSDFPVENDDDEESENDFEYGESEIERFGFEEEGKVLAEREYKNNDSSFNKQEIELNENLKRRSEDNIYSKNIQPIENEDNGKRKRKSFPDRKNDINKNGNKDLDINKGNQKKEKKNREKESGDNYEKNDKKFLKRRGGKKKSNTSYVQTDEYQSGNDEVSVKVDIGHGPDSSKSKKEFEALEKLKRKINNLEYKTSEIKLLEMKQSLVDRNSETVLLRNELQVLEERIQTLENEKQNSGSHNEYDFDDEGEGEYEDEDDNDDMEENENYYQNQRENMNGNQGNNNNLDDMDMDNEEEYGSEDYDYENKTLYNQKRDARLRLKKLQIESQLDKERVERGRMGKEQISKMKKTKLKKKRNKRKKMKKKRKRKVKKNEDSNDEYEHSSDSESDSGSSSSDSDSGSSEEGVENKNKVNKRKKETIVYQFQSKKSDIDNSGSESYVPNKKGNKKKRKKNKSRESNEEVIHIVKIGKGNKTRVKRSLRKGKKYRYSKRDNYIESENSDSAIEYSSSYYGSVNKKKRKEKYLKNSKKKSYRNRKRKDYNKNSGSDDGDSDVNSGSETDYDHEEELSEVGEDYLKYHLSSKRVKGDDSVILSRSFERYPLKVVREKKRDALIIVLDNLQFLDMNGLCIVEQVLKTYMMKFSKKSERVDRKLVRGKKKMRERPSRKVEYENNSSSDDERINKPKGIGKYKYYSNENKRRTKKFDTKKSRSYGNRMSRKEVSQANEFVSQLQEDIKFTRSVINKEKRNLSKKNKRSKDYLTRLFTLKEKKKELERKQFALEKVLDQIDSKSGKIVKRFVKYEY